MIATIDTVVQQAKTLSRDEQAILLARLSRQFRYAEAGVKNMPPVSIKKPIRTLDKALQSASGKGSHLTDDDLDQMRYERLLRKHGGNEQGFL